MVWEDWAEILRANPRRAMSGIMRSACLYGRAHVEPSCPHLGLMLRQVGPMLSHVGPILGLCWAKLGPCWAMLGLSWAHVGPVLAYVGPMLAHVEPSWELCWGHVWAIYVESILRCNFFHPGTPPGAQNHVKNRGFLASPRWNSLLPKGPKHRKKRRRQNTMAVKDGEASKLRPKAP